MGAAFDELFDRILVSDNAIEPSWKGIEFFQPFSVAANQNSSFSFIKTSIFQIVFIDSPVT